eukprot:Em0296g1a
MFQCPICEQNTSIPVGGASVLPQNLHLGFEVEVAGYMSKMVNNITHKSHSVKEIPTVAKTHQMEITGALEDAKEVVTKLTGAIEGNNRMIEQVEISKQTAFLAINQAFEILQQTLEERKKTLLSELEAISLSKTTALTLQKEHFEKMVGDIGHYTDMASQILQTHTDHEIVALGGLIPTELQATLKRVQTIFLTPNQHSNISVSVQTDDLVRQLSKLGEIIVFSPSLSSSTWMSTSVAKVGTRYHVKVQSKTSKGEEYPHGGVEMKGEMRSKTHNGAVVYGEVEDHRDGTYTITLTPQTAGPHQLLITMDGQQKNTIGSSGSGDGQFSYPSGISIKGEVFYVADTDNQRVQKLTSSGKFLHKFGKEGSGQGQFNGPGTNSSQLWDSAFAAQAFLEGTNGSQLWDSAFAAQAFLEVRTKQGEQKSEMKQYPRNVQRDDEGWGLYTEGKSTVFGTALNYVTMRLLGVIRDVARARTLLHHLGGAVCIPSWGKFWLAVLNVYHWNGVHCLFPELWWVYLPMGYCYALRLSGKLTKITMELREELYTQAYDTINWASQRNNVAPGDVYTPHSRVLDWSYRILNTYEPWHVKKLRSWAVSECLDNIRADDQFSNCISVGPISKVIQMLVRWHADGPDSETFKTHVRRPYLFTWAPAFHPYGSQQYPSRAAPKLVYSGAPTAAGSSQGVLSAAGWHQILGSVCQCSYPQQMYDISHDARGKENLISRAGGFKGVKNSPSIMKATSSSFNVLAELEAIRHKRDEAAQQNEAPVAGSVEGQSVPVKIETLVRKVV